MSINGFLDLVPVNDTHHILDYALFFEELTFTLNRHIFQYIYKLSRIESTMGKSFGVFKYIRETSISNFMIYWIISFFIFGVLQFLAVIFFNSISLNGAVLQPDFKGFLESIFSSMLIGTFFDITKVVTNSLSTILLYIQVFFSAIIILIVIDKLFIRLIHPNYSANKIQDKKINTAALMMSIFRNDVEKIHKEHDTGKKLITLKEVEATIDGLYVAFLDVEKLSSAKNTHRHKISPSQYEMVLVGIEDSLAHLESFITYLEEQKIDWRDKSIKFWLNYILETADKIALNTHHMGHTSGSIVFCIENIKNHIESIQVKLDEKN